ncbi:hypothetical protein CFP56_010121 [Quercus suber]|uniref:Uncharacterized protein n=1 Tax=Quercus suber TaxID=58331 RepID=A0AAW0L061_QUESU
MNELVGSSVTVVHGALWGGGGDLLVVGSGAERAWQDRDVLAGLLHHLNRRRYSQLWSRSHGRHSS